jgi:hypothetical protein
MALNPVQVKFVNEVVRPMVERLILFRSELDAFVLDFDNQQTALPTTAVALDDNAAGTAPRTDAPAITGAQATSLRTFCVSMRDQITPASLNTLVNVSARSVEQILRTGG